MLKDQTRRRFIIDSAKTAGAAIGTTILGREILLPQASEAANMQFPESNCGVQNKTTPKILVTYASQYGTTVEVAEAIGEVLCRNGATVETKWVSSVKNLNNYTAVIIGSAIQYDRWMPEATEFIMANQNVLSKLSVAYFFTCLTLYKQTEKAEHKAMIYSEKLSSLVPQIRPVSVGRFAGVLDYSRMSLFFRIIAKGLFAIMNVPEGDYRDWDAIRSWTNEIHSKLLIERRSQLTPAS